MGPEATTGQQGRRRVGIAAGRDRPLPNDAMMVMGRGVTAASGVFKGIALAAGRW